MLCVCLARVSYAQSLVLGPVDTSTRHRFECLFDGSVTIGASVSSGFGGVTPASELVSKSFGKSLLKNLSGNGQSGIASVAKLRTFLENQPKDKPSNGTKVRRPSDVCKYQQ